MKILYTIGYLLKQEVGVSHVYLKAIVEKQDIDLTKERAEALLAQRVKQHPDKKWIIQEYFTNEH